MRVHGEDYAAAVQRLRERGPGGACWGDTGLIGTFAGAYAECSRVGVEALTGLHTVIGTTGGCMASTAGSLHGTETLIQQDVQKLHGGSDRRWV
ncbi:hypothetical protein GCM10023075_36450 [Streptosporangium album]